MKAFISVDLEGVPYIVIPGHLSLKGTLYDEARKIATKVTLIVAEELNKKLGLSIQKVYGSCRKEPFEQTKSNRLVIIAEKGS